MTVGDLKTLQYWMASVLFRDLTKKGRIRNAAVRWIAPNTQMTAAERLEVYHQQYWYRLLESLDEDFPGVKAVLGAKAFDRLCRDYLVAHPSRSWTLRNLGDRLPTFLPEGLARDMARFEWAKIVAFAAAARPRIAPEELAGADPARLKLRLQPHLNLLDLGHPVAYWNLKRPLPRPRPSFTAVYRLDETVYHKALDPAAYALLKALNKGQTLEKACLKALAVSPEAGPKAGDWFQNWAGLGWFVSPDSGS